MQALQVPLPLRLSRQMSRVRQARHGNRRHIKTLFSQNKNDARPLDEKAESIAHVLIACHVL
jgi:hypothetical protein